MKAIGARSGSACRYMSCDIHSNEWVEASKLTGKTIYHFGTGNTMYRPDVRRKTRKFVSRSRQEGKEELSAYYQTGHAECAAPRSNMSPISAYLSDQSGFFRRFRRRDRCSPCEFSHPHGKRRIWRTDGPTGARSVTAKTKPGRLHIFYMYWKDSILRRPIIRRAENRAAVKRLEDFKTVDLQDRLRGCPAHPRLRRGKKTCMAADTGVTPFFRRARRGHDDRRVQNDERAS